MSAFRIPEEAIEELVKDNQHFGISGFINDLLLDLKAAHEIIREHHCQFCDGHACD